MYHTSRARVRGLTASRRLETRSSITNRKFRRPRRAAGTATTAVNLLSTCLAFNVTCLLSAAVKTAEHFAFPLVRQPTRDASELMLYARSWNRTSIYIYSKMYGSVGAECCPLREHIHTYTHAREYVIQLRCTLNRLTELLSAPFQFL